MKKKLTMELVKSLMEESYTLVWTDCRDNLDGNRDLLQECLDKRSPEPLWDKTEEWYGDSEWEAAKGIMEKLKEECILFHDFDEGGVESCRY